MPDNRVDAEAKLARGFDVLRGKCCGLIESFGLDPKQERAIISTFKSLTYDQQRELTDTVKSLIE